MALSKYEIIKALEEMKLSELNELVKGIEDHFGVVAAAAAPAEAAAAAGPSEVNIVLTDTGPSKVAIIKLVKEITGKELLAAKAIIDKLPAVIKEKVKIEEAEEIKGKLLTAGASVDLK